MMPSQQSSFSGTRTLFAPQLLMGASEAASVGPWKIPHPWMHAYSAPERATPWRTTGVPTLSTSRFPCTPRPGSGGTTGAPYRNASRMFAVVFWIRASTRLCPKASRPQLHDVVPAEKTHAPLGAW